jgi:hypothetical protein
MKFRPTPEMKKRCRCGEMIFFAESAKDGRPMPIEIAPDPHGNVVVAPSRLDAHGNEIAPVATVLNKTKADAYRAAGMPLYLSHFATCKKADEYRRGRR